MKSWILFRTALTLTFLVGPAAFASGNEGCKFTKPAYCEISTGASNWITVRTEASNSSTGCYTPSDIGILENKVSDFVRNEVQAKNPELECKIDRTTTGSCGSPSYQSPTTFTARCRNRVADDQLQEKICGDLARCAVVAVSQGDDTGRNWAIEQSRALKCGTY